MLVVYCMTGEPSFWQDASVCRGTAMASWNVVGKEASNVVRYLKSDTYLSGQILLLGNCPQFSPSTTLYKFSPQYTGLTSIFHRSPQDRLLLTSTQFLTRRPGCLSWIFGVSLFPLDVGSLWLCSSSHVTGKDLQPSTLAQDSHSLLLGIDPYKWT